MVEPTSGDVVRAAWDTKTGDLVRATDEGEARQPDPRPMTATELYRTWFGLDRLTPNPHGNELRRYLVLAGEVSRTEPFSVFGFQSGLLRDAAKIEVRIFPGVRLLLPTDSNGEGGVPEGIDLIRNQADVLRRPAVFTLRRQSDSFGREVFSLIRVSHLEIGQTTKIDAIPSSIVSGGFVLVGGVIVTRRDEATVWSQLCSSMPIVREHRRAISWRRSGAPSRGARSTASIFSPPPGCTRRRRHARRSNRRSATCRPYLQVRAEGARHAQRPLQRSDDPCRRLPSPVEKHLEEAVRDVKRLAKKPIPTRKTPKR